MSSWRLNPFREPKNPKGPRPFWKEHWDKIDYILGGPLLWIEHWGRSVYSPDSFLFTEHWDNRNYTPARRQIWVEQWKQDEEDTHLYEFNGYILGHQKFQEIWTI